MEHLKISRRHRYSTVCRLGWVQCSIYVYLEDTWNTYRFLEDTGTVLSADWDGCSAVFMFIWRIHGTPIDF